RRGLRLSDTGRRTGGRAARASRGRVTDVQFHEHACDDGAGCATRPDAVQPRIGSDGGAENNGHYSSSFLLSSNGIGLVPCPTLPDASNTRTNVFSCSLSGMGLLSRGQGERI